MLSVPTICNWRRVANRREPHLLPPLRSLPNLAHEIVQRLLTRPGMHLRYDAVGRKGAIALLGTIGFVRAVARSTDTQDSAGADAAS